MLLFVSIMGILLGILSIIVNVRDIIKAKENGDDEDIFSRSFVIGGIGSVILGVMLIAWSFTN